MPKGKTVQKPDCRKESRVFDVHECDSYENLNTLEMHESFIDPNPRSRPFWEKSEKKMIKIE